jgi:hypothetical protein
MALKRTALILLSGLLILSGCASRYVITLHNGRSYTAMGKPRLDKTKNRYVFKDPAGEQHEVSPLSVREISPESMQEKSKFISSPPR